MDPDTANHIVELRQVTIGYGHNNVILDGINLTVQPGEMVALMGRNGTGKSTLLKSMIGLIPFLEGTCYMDRVPLHRYGIRQRARKVSYVAAQLSQPPSISVAELVALGRMPHTGWMGRLGAADKAMVINALEEVQMRSLMDRKMDRLSDGERQRVMIARAFVQDTPLMVLDEPAAFLDIPNKFELIRLLRRFRNGGKSIVYSTHDLESAMMCADKIWVIHRGNIVEGAPEDLGIAGIFRSLFEESGITFEEESRRFRYSEAPVGSISLSGIPGTSLTWTRSALERIGYTVEESAASHLEVEQSGNRLRWILSMKGTDRAFLDIYSLARFLKKPN